MEYPIYIDGTKKGTLCVTQEKLHLAFYAECEYVPQLVRLSVFGGGKSGYLGVMEPKGDKLTLFRRKSRRELEAFPRPIEYAADRELTEETENIWYSSPEGVLSNGECVAIPANLRRKISISRIICGREYIVFPRK